MDISTERNRSEASTANPRSAIRKALLRMIRWLIECVTLSEADRKKAGIFIRRTGA